VLSVVAAISASPDVDAFMGGVKLGLAVFCFILVGLGGLALARRIFGA
jgi:hypothetical protein